MRQKEKEKQNKREKHGKTWENKGRKEKQRG